MMDFIATPLMAIEILIAEFMFSSRLEKKSYFWIRFIGSVTICLCLTVWIEVVYSLITGKGFEYGIYDGVSDSIFKFFYYLVIFILTILCFRFSFNGSVWMILLFCSGGYATQHIAKSVASLFELIPYFSTSGVGAKVAFYACKYIIYACVYVVTYLLFIRNKPLPQGDEKNAKSKIVLSLIVIFICVGISRLTTDNPDRGLLAIFSETLYAIVSCVLVLYILHSLNENDKIRYEADMMSELLHREREQFNLSKQNIELINIKCHDLKHQLSALRGGASEEYIAEMEKAIMIYDSVVKTDNDVLDVILTEKSLLCEKQNINLTCAANGKDLTFMDKMDLYSLFGNALSNAIESVSKITDEKKRCIAINVKSVGNLLSIHVENFYEGEIKFNEGLPVTRGNKDYHGYGMLSMQSIAKKYGGAMTVSAQNNKFSLDFIIPVK